MHDEIFHHKHRKLLGPHIHYIHKFWKPFNHLILKNSYFSAPKTLTSGVYYTTTPSVISRAYYNLIYILSKFK